MTNIVTFKEISTLSGEFDYYTQTFIVTDENRTYLSPITFVNCGGKEIKEKKYREKWRERRQKMEEDKNFHFSLQRLIKPIVPFYLWIDLRKIDHFKDMICKRKRKRASNSLKSYWLYLKQKIRTANYLSNQYIVFRYVKCWYNPSVYLRREIQIKHLVLCYNIF